MVIMRYESIATLFNTLLETHAHGIGQTELAKMLGTAQSIISRVKKGEVLPPKDVVRNIELLWGVDISQEVEQARRQGSRVPSRATKNADGIPYYDVDFFGGFDLVVNDQSSVPDGYIKINKYDKATCLCNITGHSMEPEINHGDIIVLRKIDDWHFLPFGEIYAIVTHNDMRTVKRIGPAGSDDAYMLYPSNKSPEYAPQELKKKDILQVFEVMGCMKRF